jgi:heme exporter protein D
MREFFSMGGYAPYVWSAYGITLLVLALNVWWAARRKAAMLQRLKRSRSERPAPVAVRQVS